MTTICRIIGAAGVGKTSHLMRVLTEWLEKRDVNPFQVGFVSFTRAARSEAAGRAAEIAGVGKDELEQSGWFRTVHSVAYRQLGVGKELLTDKKESRKWIADALGVGDSDVELDEAEDQPTAVRDNASEESNALALWGVARARLEPLRKTWDRASEINEFVPDWPTVQNVIERYEQAKRLDGRCDFTDILGRYAGVRFEIDGPCDKAYEGEVPGLPIWFLDEWQDASALLDRCARRMTDGSDVIYVAADPFQAIYGFGGSNPKYFYDWEPTAGKERILNHSYRCPAEFIELGEDILRDCTDYWDRGVTPNGQQGEIDTQMLDGSWAQQLDPRVKTLVIARSNAHVRRLIAKLDALGLPWVPTRGMGGKWAAPTRRAALLGLINLQHDDTIYAHEWSAALKLLPSKANGEELIAHGGKTAWKDQDRGSDERMDLAHLDNWYATPHLIELIRAGRWQSLIENGQDFFYAWREWGEESVVEPQIQVGTIHSVKGAECDHCVLLTTTSRQCTKSYDYDESADEERRVMYVAVTRARKQLTILKEKCLHQMRLPL